MKTFASALGFVKTPLVAVESGASALGGALVPGPPCGCIPLPKVSVTFEERRASGSSNQCNWIGANLAEFGAAAVQRYYRESVYVKRPWELPGDPPEDYDEAPATITNTFEYLYEGADAFDDGNSEVCGIAESTDDWEPANKSEYENNVVIYDLDSENIELVEIPPVTAAPLGEFDDEFAEAGTLVTANYSLSGFADGVFIGRSAGRSAVEYRAKIDLSDRFWPDGLVVTGRLLIKEETTFTAFGAEEPTVSETLYAESFSLTEAEPIWLGEIREARPGSPGQLASQNNIRITVDEVFNSVLPSVDPL
jgi:hypothetical protein